MERRDDKLHILIKKCTFLYSTSVYYFQLLFSILTRTSETCLYVWCSIFYHEFNANIKCFVGIKSKTNDFDLHSLFLHHKLYLNKLWKKITQNTLFKLIKRIFLLFLSVVVEKVKPEIVAFATGNSSLSVESLANDGRCIIDSHALAVARRALLM